MKGAPSSCNVRITVMIVNCILSVIRKGMPSASSYSSNINLQLLFTRNPNPSHPCSTYRGLGFCQYVADELRIKVFARVHQGFLDRHIGRDCTWIEGR